MPCLFIIARSFQFHFYWFDCNPVSHLVSASLCSKIETVKVNCSLLFLNSITLFGTNRGGYVALNEDKKLLMRCDSGREIEEGTNSRIVTCVIPTFIAWNWATYHAACIHPILPDVTQWLWDVENVILYKMLW